MIFHLAIFCHQLVILALTLRFVPIANFFRLDLAKISAGACHFQLDHVNFVPVACHFQSDKRIFASVARHFHIDTSISLETLLVLHQKLVILT